MPDKINFIVLHKTYMGGVEIRAHTESGELIKIESDQHEKLLGILGLLPTAINAHGYKLERGAQQKYRRLTLN